MHGTKNILITGVTSIGTIPIGPNTAIIIVMTGDFMKSTIGTMAGGGIKDTMAITIEDPTRERGVGGMAGATTTGMTTAGEDTSSCVGRQATLPSAQQAAYVLTRFIDSLAKGLNFSIIVENSHRRWS
jgi:hypothetical protein